MKKLIILLLLTAMSFAYLAVPNMDKPAYPAGSEVKSISLVEKATALAFNDFANLGVSKITMLPSNSSLNVKAIVSPSAVIGVPGTAYKAADIQFKNFVGTADVEFAVSVAWLAQNSLQADDIILYHKATDWEQITSFSKMIDLVADNYIYYKATGLSKFSVYALSTKPIPVAPPVVVPEPVKEEKKPFDFMPLLIAIGVIVIIAAFGVLWVFYRKKVLFQESEDEHQQNAKNKKQ